jgi:plasmid stabilization system protein ParE
MPNSVVWTQKALHDYRSTVEYWDLRNKSTAYTKRLNRLIYIKIQTALRFPYAFRLIGLGLRQLVVENFILLYSIQDEQLVVVHFRDSRMRPLEIPTP